LTKLGTPQDLEYAINSNGNPRAQSFIQQQFTLSLLQLASFFFIDRTGYI
jgi:hypothetical protein